MADAYRPSILPQPQIHSALVKRKANHILRVCFRKPDQCCFDIPATHVPISTNGSISGRPPLQMEWGSWLLNQHFPSCWQYRVMRRFKGKRGKGGKRWEGALALKQQKRARGLCRSSSAKPINCKLFLQRCHSFGPGSQLQLYNAGQACAPLPAGLGQGRLRTAPGRVCGPAGAPTGLGWAGQGRFPRAHGRTSRRRRVAAPRGGISAHCPSAHPGPSGGKKGRAVSAAAPAAVGGARSALSPSAGRGESPAPDSGSRLRFPCKARSGRANKTRRGAPSRERAGPRAPGPAPGGGRSPRAPGGGGRRRPQEKEVCSPPPPPPPTGLRYRGAGEPSPTPARPHPLRLPRGSGRPPAPPGPAPAPAPAPAPYLLGGRAAPTPPGAADPPSLGRARGSGRVGSAGGERDPPGGGGSGEWGAGERALGATRLKTNNSKRKKKLNCKNKI